MITQNLTQQMGLILLGGAEMIMAGIKPKIK
jgi:hypothetical protein